MELGHAFYYGDNITDYSVVFQCKNGTNAFCSVMDTLNIPKQFLPGSAELEDVEERPGPDPPLVQQGSFEEIAIISAAAAGATLLIAGVGIWCYWRRKGTRKGRFGTWSWNRGPSFDEERQGQLTDGVSTTEKWALSASRSCEANPTENMDYSTFAYDDHLSVSDRNEFLKAIGDSTRCSTRATKYTSQAPTVTTTTNVSCVSMSTGTSHSSRDYTSHGGGVA